MKEGWKYVKLGEVCEKLRDGSHNPPKGVGCSDYFMLSSQHVQYGSLSFDNVRYLDKNSFESEHKRTNVRKGDVLLTIVGTIGRSCVFQGEVDNITFQRSVAIITPKNILDSNYLMYCFWHLQDSLQEKAHGVAQKGLYLKQLAGIPIPLPPLSEQERIVSKLDAAFARIDAVKKEAEEMLEEAKAIFAAALRDTMKPHEGWEEKTLGEICQVINGRAYLKPEMLNSGKYKLLRVGNFFTNDNWYYTDLELDEKKYCEEGDLLYAWSASFGPKIWHGEKVVYHYHIWKMICDETIVDRLFMYYWLDSDELKTQAMSNLHGSTMAHITKSIIEKCIVRFPPLDLQRAIVTHLDNMSAKVRELEEGYKKTVAECDALKQAILRETFE